MSKAKEILEAYEPKGEIETIFNKERQNELEHFYDGINDNVHRIAEFRMQLEGYVLMFRDDLQIFSFYDRHQLPYDSKGKKQYMKMIGETLQAVKTAKTLEKDIMKLKQTLNYMEKNF